MTAIAAKSTDEEPAVGQPTNSRRRFLVFRLDSQSYALAVDSIREIVFAAELQRPPGIPELCAGILNLAGEAIAVVRLAELFRLNWSEPTRYTPYIIVESRAGVLALQVDEVTRIIRNSEARFLPVPQGRSMNESAIAAVWLDDAVALLLDPDRLLLQEERMFLEQLTAAQKLRISTLQEIGR